ncbi:MAG: hemin uptake protein HemP [Sterolibacterium sp.]
MPAYSVPQIRPLHFASMAVSAQPIDSESLLGTRGEVEIFHSGETYRLRRTRQGKLILTK